MHHVRYGLAYISVWIRVVGYIKLRLLLQLDRDREGAGIRAMKLY